MSKTFTKSFGPLDYIAQPHDFTGDDNLGIATNDATQRYVLGRRSLEWDGTLFKYGKAGATMTSYQAGAWHNDTTAGISYEAMGAASAAGSKQVTLTQGSITEDQYQGGHLLLFHATGDGDIYLISGNEATSGTTTIFYLDRPLSVAVTTSDNLELYANPWKDVRQGNSGGTKGFCGPPMALITSGYYGWIKTRGVTFISPQSTVGNQGLAAGYWRHDGSIDVRGNISAGTVSDQYAGYRMVGSAATDGPLFMLQGSF